MALAFTLDVDHLDGNADASPASLVRFEGWELLTRHMDDRPDKIPPRLFFEANMRVLRSLDYPVNDQGWPIMSRRMREALVSAGEFAHRAVPVVMLDHSVVEKFDRAGSPRPGVALHGYAAMHFPQYVDAFDWQRSQFVPHPRVEGRVLSVEQLVLKDVPLPPLFRLAAMPQMLLVSERAREALLAAKIRGVRMRPIS